MSQPECAVIITFAEPTEESVRNLERAAQKLPAHTSVIAACRFFESDGSEFLKALRKLFKKDVKFVDCSRISSPDKIFSKCASLVSEEILVFLSWGVRPQEACINALVNELVLNPETGIAAPVLLYPDSTPLGPIVRNAGNFINPFFQTGSLYKGVPAASPLIKKRRYLQSVPWDCLAMRKNLLMRRNANFTDKFSFCKLFTSTLARGSKITLVPEAKAIMTNASLADMSAQECLALDASPKSPSPDWSALLDQDNLDLSVSSWLLLSPKPPAAELDRLQRRLQGIDDKRLAALLIGRPFWEKGWLALLQLNAKAEARRKCCEIALALFPNPHIAQTIWQMALRSEDRELFAEAKKICESFIKPAEEYLKLARSCHEYCERAAYTDLSKKYMRWIENFPSFTENIYYPFIRNWFALCAMSGERLDHRNIFIYRLWLSATPKSIVPENQETGFSIIMPVYNPNPEFLKKAIDSVLAQSYGNWQLCMADDASTDKTVRSLLEEYAKKDRRISITFRSANGHIAAASNSALALANKPWALFMDQDDLLAPDALAIAEKYLRQNPGVQMLFSDEDHIDEKDNHFSPHFKNGKWDSELLLGENFVCHLAVYKTDLLRELGGLRSEMNGAQDFDLVLRYTKEIPLQSIIHIPHILYHWRTHAGSTSASLASKPYALKNSLKAVQSFLDRHKPGSRALMLNNTARVRVQYPEPVKKPLASIILHVGDYNGSLSELAKRLDSQTLWPHEIIFVGGALPKELPDPNCHFYISEKDEITALNEAAAQASGELLAFLSPACVPANSSWLNELATRLLQGDIGAIGGKLLREKGLLCHGGYIADASGSLKPLFKNDAGRYYDWGALPRTVDGLDLACLMLRKDNFLNAGALNPDMAGWAGQDLCLRLAKLGLSSVWHPFSELFGKTLNLPPKPAAFAKKWDGILVPFNKNLLVTNTGFSLLMTGQN